MRGGNPSPRASAQRTQRRIFFSCCATGRWGRGPEAGEARPRVLCACIPPATARRRHLRPVPLPQWQRGQMTAQPDRGREGLDAGGRGRPARARRTLAARLRPRARLRMRDRRARPLGPLRARAPGRPRARPHRLMSSKASSPAHDHGWGAVRRVEGVPIAAFCGVGRPAKSFQGPRPSRRRLRLFSSVAPPPRARLHTRASSPWTTCCRGDTCQSASRRMEGGRGRALRRWMARTTAHTHHTARNRAVHSSDARGKQKSQVREDEGARAAGTGGGTRGLGCARATQAWNDGP
jgi:hypothetical protein